jgi:inorganic pyrophosphatase
MTDEAGPDGKIVAVPIDRLSTQYRHIHTMQDLPQQLLNQIEHFFDHYKDLEANRWVTIEGWEDREGAYQEILSSIERFNNAPVKPFF